MILGENVVGVAVDATVHRKLAWQCNCHPNVWLVQRDHWRSLAGKMTNAVSQSGRQQREVYYAGRVQGVGFRYTVRSLAGGFDVTGFVRNLPDGRVHLVVEGAAEEIDAILAAIKAEMGYYIGEVQESVRPAGGRFPSFEIRH